MKNNNKYSVYMNCRLTNKENKNLNNIMNHLKIYNKSKAIRWLINNNKFIKKNSGGV